MCTARIDIDTALPPYKVEHVGKFYTSYSCHVPDSVELKGCRKLRTTLRSEFREVLFKT